MLRTLAVAILALVLVAGCQRPTFEECDTLCWRYAELSFWAEFDEQAKDLSPADRAELKQAKDAEWKELRAKEQDHGRDNCKLACRQGGNKKQVACMAKVTTLAEAKACMKD